MVKSSSNAAGFIGYAQDATINVSGCTVTRSTFVGKNENKQGAYFGTVNVGAIVNISNTTADMETLVGQILLTGSVNYN